MNGQALAPEPDEEQVVVPATVAGQRLDSYLAEALRDTGLSRTRLARALKAGAVRLAPTTTNPQPLSAAYRLRGNETLLLRTGLLRTDLLHPETPAASNSDPQNQAAAHSLAPRILYEDEAIIVLDKPAGMVVHPAVGNPAGTLLQGLRALGKTHSQQTRGGLVHRLDKGTSGVLVAARTPQAETHLARQFAAHTIERRYLALVSGVPTPAAGRIDGIITRDKHNRQKMTLQAPCGSATMPDLNAPNASAGFIVSGKGAATKPAPCGAASVPDLNSSKPPAGFIASSEGAATKPAPCGAATTPSLSAPNASAGFIASSKGAATKPAPCGAATTPSLSASNPSAGFIASSKDKLSLRRTTASPKGKASHTQYRLRCQLANGQAALLELRPGTGRTHQIRVHCAALGHSVLGDSTYGGGARRLKQLLRSLAPPRENGKPEAETRPLLHAWRLGFVHPVSEEFLSFTVPPPADFLAVLHHLDTNQTLPQEETALHQFLLAPPA